MGEGPGMSKDQCAAPRQPSDEGIQLVGTREREAWHAVEWDRNNGCAGSLVVLGRGLCSIE